MKSLIKSNKNKLKLRNSLIYSLSLTAVAHNLATFLNRSRGSSVNIVSGYGLDDRAIGVRSSAGAKDFSLYPLYPDRLWGPPSLLYNGYRGSFSRG
jgi:hypothetical protein